MGSKRNSLRRELLRKLIHLSVLGAVPLMNYSEWLTVYLLCFGSMVYAASEQLRLEMISQGLNPVKTVQNITLLLARDRESADIVWGPVTLALGAVTVILMFPGTAASAGIFCLALGDSAALIAGKTIGGPKLPLSKEKSISGAAACWIVCSAVVWVHTGDVLLSVFAGAAGAAVESVQLHNADNLLLPLTVAAVVEAGLMVL